VSELGQETIYIKMQQNQIKNMLSGKSVANFSGTFVPWRKDAISFPARVML
jgi:hypothetical protein